MKLTRTLFLILLNVIVISLVHLAIYGSTPESITQESVSNSMFVVGTLTFFPAIALKLGSTNIFLGFRYSIYRFTNAGKKAGFTNFKDYYDAKRLEPKGTLYNEVLLISAMVVAVSFYLAFTWSP